VHNKEGDNKPLSQRVRELRGKLKQEDFARRVGVDQTTISNWERGIGKPTPDSLVELANLAEGEARTFFLRQAHLVEGKSYIAARRAIAQETSEKTVPFDQELLTFAIVTINQELRKRNRKFTDDRKYATLVVLFYELCHRTGSRDSGMVEQLLKIA